MRLGTGFSPKMQKLEWRPIDDQVMGGVSASAVEPAADGSSVFSGVVSTRYGGGFASVRAATPGLDLSAFRGLKLRLRGDGKRYKINLKNSPGFDGPLFQASFSTLPAGEWIDIALAFSDFVPTFRGNELSSDYTLDAGRIESIGIMISEKQAGEFRLEIQTLECY